VYGVEIRAKNIAGAGPWSPARYIRTNPAAFLAAPPRDVEIVDTTLW
jgi:hypothetical protein